LLKIIALYKLAETNIELQVKNEINSNENDLIKFIENELYDLMKKAINWNMCKG
jgi:hypothetical protein